MNTNIKNTMHAHMKSADLLHDMSDSKDTYSRWSTQPSSLACIDTLSNPLIVFCKRLYELGFKHKHKIIYWYNDLLLAIFKGLILWLWLYLIYKGKTKEVLEKIMMLHSAWLLLILYYYAF